MNIDISTIAGYETMTAEEKVAALEGFNIPDPVDLSGYVKKGVFDQTASEAASWKKKYRDSLDAAERDKQEREEKDKETAEKLAQYERKEAISNNVQNLLKQGYPAEHAQAVAEAMVSGDTAAFMEANGAALAAMEKISAAKSMKNVPRGASGSGTNGGEAEETDYEEEIKAAKERGDMANLAKLIRQQHEAAMKQNK